MLVFMGQSGKWWRAVRAGNGGGGCSGEEERLAFFEGVEVGHGDGADVSVEEAEHGGTAVAAPDGGVAGGGGAVGDVG